MPAKLLFGVDLDPLACCNLGLDDAAIPFQTSKSFRPDEMVQVILTFFQVCHLGDGGDPRDDFFS